MVTEARMFLSSSTSAMVAIGMPLQTRVSIGRRCPNQSKAMADSAPNPPIPETYDPRRFRTTVPFYARYRLPYPRALIDRVIGIVGMRPGDAVMDLGTGPGLLAILFAQAGMDVVAIDPEPEMLGAARAAAGEAGVGID